MYHKVKMPTLPLCILLCLGFLFLFKAFFVFRGEIGDLFFEQFQISILNSQAPSIYYVGETEKGTDFDKLCKSLFLKTVPVYSYAKGYPETAMESQDQELMHQLILSEGRDEIHVGEQDTNIPQETLESETIAPDSDNLSQTAASPQTDQNVGETQFQETPVLEVNMASAQPLEDLKDFETLMSKYYAIDSTTYIDGQQLNVEKLLSYDMRLQTQSDQPQILIYHTHSQEGFVDSDFSDPSTTIVGAGELLARYLRGYGFHVIHHTGKYDVDNRDYAYSYAGPAVEEILKENPSIEVIIDLHRDGVAEDTHMVTQIGDKTMAQFMFFNGLSRTVARGDIAYLKNEHIDENLAFSFQAQRVANAYYPGLARKIYLKGYRYNMHYRGKSLLIELGAQTNTVEEIMNAVEPLANILKLTLEGKGAE